MGAIAERYRRNVEGMLAVGYLRGIAEDAIPSSNRRFRELYPRVEALYEPYSYSDLPKALMEGNIAVAIGVSFDDIDGDVPSEGFSRAYLLLDRICVVASGDHPLSRNPLAKASASDLANETILTYPSSKPFTGRNDISEFFGRAGVRVSYLDRFDSLERLPLQLVTEECIALLPAHLEPFFRASHVGEFSFTPLEGAPLVVFQVLWRGDDPFACAFAELFLRCYA